MTVRIYGLQTDPDTKLACSILENAHIQWQLVDVEKAGILANLERDLDVRELPFLLVQNGKVEGLKAIKGFVAQTK